MELLKITKAKYVEKYKIDLSFNNGFSAIVDLKEKIFSDHRKVFTKLQDINFFKKFSKNRWTIEWENGVDLAPEYLYKLAKKEE